MIGHRTKDASNMQREISDKVRKLMYTTNPILLSTSSGSGLMEGAIRSLTAKRAMVFSVGAFGNRWFKMAEANNVPADKFESKRGKPTTPEIVDQYLSTGKYDVFTVTHNETSTGIMNPVEEIAEVKLCRAEWYSALSAIKNQLRGVPLRSTKKERDHNENPHHRRNRKIRR